MLRLGTRSAWSACAATTLFAASSVFAQSPASAPSATTPLPPTSAAPATPPPTSAPPTSAPSAAATPQAPGSATPPAGAVPAATAPAPAAAAPPPAHPAPAAPVVRHDTALVHLAGDYPGLVLELRNYVESGEWGVACAAPCDRVLVTLGAEARVSAPGMSRSNAFRIDPGPGVAHVRVSGGSATLRSLGILGLGIGIPVGLGGAAMYSYGSYKDQNGLTVAGGIVFGTGALMILAALPMLLSSTTTVRDAKGGFIAEAAAVPEAN